MASENRLPAFDRPGLDSHGSLLCNWQVDDNSEGIRAVSVLGVAALEPAPFAQPRTLLVVGKGYSVAGQLGEVFLPGHPACPHRRRQEWVVFHEGKMSKFAGSKLARLPHLFSNKCPLSIIGLRGEIDL